MKRRTNSRKSLKPLFRVCLQRHDADCAVVSLAHALSLPYEAVLIVASRIAPKVLTRGLYSVEIVLIAENFGRELVKKKGKVDLDTDTGVLIIQFTNKSEHAAYLTNGLVFETNGDVWEAEQYLKRYNAKVLHLLEEK